MTTSKIEILAAVRRNRPAPVELPSSHGEWTTYADLRQQFIDVLQSVGGQAVIANGTDELAEPLQRLPIFSQAQRVVSLVAGVGAPNVDLSSIDSPHALDNVDIAILPGEFAVAENAAVWVTDRDLPWRVVYFLCQHLVLVVPAGQIVDHLHAAYEQIGRRGQGGNSPFIEPSFGAFISGPSKTADIEQSLVIGAHGPRSLTVCLLEE
jgi:L-lactate dehydrogenase complex protein LldG